MVAAFLRSTLAARIILTLFLGCTGVVVHTLASIQRNGDGSYTAYLMVVPLLVALIAAEVPPSPGVSDTESDWIVAVIVLAAGFLGVSLISRRLPTLAGLWHWDHYALPISAVATATVVLSIRHMLRLWRAWVFALMCAPTLPYLLVTAQLGGTENDAVAVAAAMGGIAVYLSTRNLSSRNLTTGNLSTSSSAMAFRLLAATLTFAVAIGLDRLLRLDSILQRIVIGGGALPALATVAMRGAARLRRERPSTPAAAKLPHLGRWSYSALVLLAAALLLTTLPLPAAHPVPTAANDWIARQDLRLTAAFGFIRRFLGPEATLTRYVLPAAVATPAVAVDVITAPNLARLTDYDDAIWYPSDTPVNFQSAEINGIAVAIAHSDPNHHGQSQAAGWYVLTWLWHTAGGYQRVTVVVNQDQSGLAPM